MSDTSEPSLIGGRIWELSEQDAITWLCSKTHEVPFPDPPRGTEFRNEKSSVQSLDLTGSPSPTLGLAWTSCNIASGPFKERNLKAEQMILIYFYRKEIGALLLVPRFYSYSNSLTQRSSQCIASAAASHGMSRFSSSLLVGSLFSLLAGRQRNVVFATFGRDHVEDIFKIFLPPLKLGLVLHESNKSPVPDPGVCQLLKPVSPLGVRKIVRRLSFRLAYV